MNYSGYLFVTADMFAKSLLITGKKALNSWRKLLFFLS